MNISPLTVAQLRELGWDIIRVSEVMDNRTKDAEILTYGRIHDRVLITQDLDFSMLLAVQGHAKPSVISLRLDNPTPSVAASRIVEVVAALEHDLKEGVVVTADETSVRYRTLPIRTD
jgi:predicted nuclease of predicted toxin-antitoxin system